MSKAVLISIRPKWCQKIMSGQKTIEVRKTRLKLNPPFKCYIYCTEQGINKFFREGCGGDLEKWNRERWTYRKGHVIGEFVCHEFVEINGAERITSDIARDACLAPVEIHQYLGTGTGYGWRISNLKIYNTPRELNEFRRACRNDWWCDSCAMHWAHNGTCGNESLQISRPPQSWCYVEEKIWKD